jgi:hypothetical protein
MKAAADEAQQALPSASSLVASPAADALAATAAAAVQPQRVQRRQGGSSRLLTSSLELEPGLRNHWFPAHFSSVSAELSSQDPGASINAKAASLPRVGLCLAAKAREGTYQYM